jgi:hypothetical protein
MALLFLLISYFSLMVESLNKVSTAHPRFFVLRPVTLPQPGLGRIAKQVQVLVA